jgi:tight adherence protein B
MFSPFVTVLAVAILATLSAGGIAYGLLYGRISREAQSERRIGQIQTRSSQPDPARIRSAADAARRRKSIQETLREIEEKQRAKAKRSNAPPLSLRLEQAGLEWSRRTYLIFSAGAGIVLFLLAWLIGAPIYAAAGFMVVGAIGVPRWFVNFMRKRRMKKFLDEFANAVDVVVRGIKAGLPLNDCVRIIANEAAEPVRTEFRKISETQALGVSMADAVVRMPERVPVPEANFFAIVITIQSKAGGNLAEALSNLSRVLRDRRKMKGKIQAMSMEAKASAAIIGALPIIVMGLVYLTSPKYISLLFTDPIGNIILVASGLWMLTGILVMRKMINFDF